MSNVLFNSAGKRKYLTSEERLAFITMAKSRPREVRTFCLVLAYTGCRISEALQLSADRVDLGGGMVVLETLKKRRSGVYRAVPVPPALLDALELVHGISEAQKRPDGGAGLRLWLWSRSTAWRRVQEVMQATGISGPQASPKGLRHGFGVAAVQANIPLNLVQRWLGHADLATTAIYVDAVGVEEKELAARMWQ